MNGISSLLQKHLDFQMNSVRVPPVCGCVSCDEPVYVRLVEPFVLNTGSA